MSTATTSTPAHRVEHPGRTTFHTIIVPLDGSEFAEQALPLATRIAAAAEARLDLFHSHELYGGYYDNALCWAPYDAELERDAKKLERSYLEETAKRLNAAAPARITTALGDGAPCDTLLARVHAQHAGLVVMTTHCRGPLGRTFLGGVADELIRRAHVPVLLIPGRKAGSPQPEIQRVLIALDGSRLAEKALRPGLELARLLGARCTLVSVIPPDGAAELETRSYLRNLTAGLHGSGLWLDVRVLPAPYPAAALLGDVCPGDILALGTHGRGGLRRLLMGSVADQVIRGASCPVLVCHDGEQG